MKKFGTLTKCPKCGVTKFEVEYKPAEFYKVKGINGEVEEIPMEDCEEYMAIECVRCGYIHKELPLDYIAEWDSEITYEKPTEVMHDGKLYIIYGLAIEPEDNK